MPPAPIPAPSVIAGLKFALRPHAPFAAMNDADLERVVRAAQIRYFEPGEIILAPDCEPAGPLLRDPAGHHPRRAPGRDRRCRRAVGAVRRRDVPAGRAARPARGDERLSRDAGHLLPRVPGRAVRHPDRDLAGVPGFLHAATRVPARPVARQPAGRVRGERDGEARSGHRPGDARPARAAVVLAVDPAVRRAGDDGRAPDRVDAGRRRRDAGRWESSPARTSSDESSCLRGRWRRRSPTS